MKRFFIAYANDLLILAGCVCVVYGLAQVHPVLAWLATGVMLIGLGVMAGRARANAN